MAIESYFKNIADAIRERAGSSGLITPAQMPQAIRAIPGGGGGWGFMDDVTGAQSVLTATLTGQSPIDITTYSADVQKLYNDYARSPKPTGKTINHIVTASDKDLTYQDILDNYGQFEMEYYGYVWGSSLVGALNLVFLADTSQAAAASGTLAAAFTQFSGVLIQGVYYSERTSGYNTTMAYIEPKLNTEYWSGMKDRNHSYDNWVTFTSPTTYTQRGYQKSIIYGIN